MAKAGDLVISRYREPILFLVFEFINKNLQVQIHKDEVSEIIDELKRLFKQEERAAVISEINGGFEELKNQHTPPFRAGLLIEIVIKPGE